MASPSDSIPPSFHPAGPDFRNPEPPPPVLPGLSPIEAHAGALGWLGHLPEPAALGWVEFESPPERRISMDAVGPFFPLGSLPSASAAVRGVLGDGLPAEASEEIHWRYDRLGKPYIGWTGNVAAWAEARGLHAGRLHVSNSHDGAAEVVLAVYAETLVGIGIDLVHLPRLRRAGKNRAYLERFARQFMSAAEYGYFLSECERSLRESGNSQAGPGDVDPGEEAVRIRVAAHFSLMEAASKACGTGLKIGVGMGSPSSLSKQAIGVRRLHANSADLGFDAEGNARLAELGARRAQAFWGADADYLVSAVLLFAE